MSTFNLKYQVLASNTGLLYKLEEENEITINYYAYELSSNFQETYLKDEEKIKNFKTIRQFVKQINYQNKKYILFKYQDGESLDRKIFQFRGRQESINFETIKLYLIQMLDTLQKLHQSNILGRIFSTKNILDCQGQILFMDFGFGPNIIEQNLDLIAPPEVIIRFLEKEGHQIYNMKVDSWLLGAVLYHLVKLSPINTIEIEGGKGKVMLQKDAHEYFSYLSKQIQNQKKCIDVITGRYSPEFCQFIQGLLTYNPDERFSFLQIYQHNFIKKLGISNYEKYLQFYQLYNEQGLNEQINIREDHGSRILSTGFLLNGVSNQPIIQSTVTNTLEANQNIIPPLCLDSFQLENNNLKVQFPVDTSELLRNSQIEDQYSIEKQFVHEIQSLYESRFYLIWSHIRMELFRFTFLELSAVEFINELQKKKFQLEHVCAYFLKKMGYLILIELLKKINEDVCPWVCNQEDQQKWKDFKKETQKSILENNIKQKIKDLEPILKEAYFMHCKIYLEDERIEQAIRNELQADLECFQKQKIESNSIYNSCSNEFLKKGYRQIILTTYKFLEREQKLAQQPHLKYNTLLLKITICHLINRIFDLNTVTNSFRKILQNKNRNPFQLITPNEIYQYICRDEEQEKINDIQEILSGKSG
ncbi:unnamed protein product [Paramecium primaurelia]|uniref:Protein kinase domain-containing protein n=1 Tax=Paramecium primaurelia TaxID=5886 RepID=A0A8S1L390_PARPR|nr:unnamed protein product [Paramecium primaurelia]